MQYYLISAIKKNVIQGRRIAEDEGITDELDDQPGAVELVTIALREKCNPQDILTSGLTEAMNTVGEKYESGEYFIPDMLAAAEAVAAAMDVLEPALVKSGIESKGNFVIATVQGDQHDIGKNIAATMLKGSGFNVIDLGIDVPPAKIAEAVKEHNARLVGLSALLTTTMKSMKETVKELEKSGVRENVKILVGGAPTSPEFVAEIGADAHCKDAFEGVAAAEKFAAEMKA